MSNKTNSALPFKTIDDLTKQCSSDFCNDDNSVKQIEDLVNARFEEILNVVKEHYIKAIADSSEVPERIEFSLSTSFNTTFITIISPTSADSLEKCRFDEKNSCEAQPFYFRVLYKKKLEEKLIEFGFKEAPNACLQLVVTPKADCFS